jgi:pimeloyl-ACP methyl ester carboxylesterase
VAAPDLPKVAPEWGLEKYASEIARSVIAPQSVLVAHSFSGVFLPLVARLRECARLVFLAAVIPEPGKSVREQLVEDPGMFTGEWITAGSRWFDRSQQESISREFLFHDCAGETLAWALTTVDLFDTRHLITQPAPFTAWPSVPAVSIVATGDRTLTADWGRRTSRRVLGKETIEIDAGHCPHVSKAEEVARILDRLGAEGSAS